MLEAHALALEGIFHCPLLNVSRANWTINHPPARISY